MGLIANRIHGQEGIVLQQPDIPYYPGAGNSYEAGVAAADLITYLCRVMPVLDGLEVPVYVDLIALDLGLFEELETMTPAERIGHIYGKFTSVLERGDPIRIAIVERLFRNLSPSREMIPNSGPQREAFSRAFIAALEATRE